MFYTGNYKVWISGLAIEASWQSHFKLMWVWQQEFTFLVFEERFLSNLTTLPHAKGAPVLWIQVNFCYCHVRCFSLYQHVSFFEAWSRENYQDSYKSIHRIAARHGCVITTRCEWLITHRCRCEKSGMCASATQHTCGCARQPTFRCMCNIAHLCMLNTAHLCIWNRAHLCMWNKVHLCS